MFGSPFIIGSVERARAMKLALADEHVAVSLALRIDRAECGGTKSSTHALHFLGTQITSASANQYSVQVIHVLSPFVVGRLSRLKVLQERVCFRVRSGAAESG